MGDHGTKEAVQDAVEDVVWFPRADLVLNHSQRVAVLAEDVEDVRGEGLELLPAREGYGTAPYGVEDVAHHLGAVHDESL